MLQFRLVMISMTLAITGVITGVNSRGIRDKAIQTVICERKTKVNNFFILYFVRGPMKIVGDKMKTNYRKEVSKNTGKT